MATDLVSSFLDRYRLAAVIQAIEEDLRSFIRQYVAPNVDAETLFGARLDEIRRRAQGDGIVDPSLSVLVDFLDFGDAFAVLNGRRGMIPDDLARLVRTLTPAFETAVPIRNRVMHGRPLQSGDEKHIATLGQTLADSDFHLPLTRGITARLLAEPDWVPLIEIATGAAERVLHNLPLPEYDETGLLGRESELRQLTEMLTRRRFPVITIAGEGGIGKTALAVETLYALADSPNPPYDVILWVSLKTEQLTGRGVEQLREAAFDLFSLTSDLSEGLGGLETDDIALLADLLVDTDVLVVIDNIETIDPSEIKRLIEALSSAQFLLTSRVGLGEMEVRVALEALGEQAAHTMLRQLAARRGMKQLARLREDQISDITAQLRRSPLAIRWFVEALEAGGQPDDLLRDQSAVLQFCMSTIYDSLDPGAHGVVECLLAVDRFTTIGEIALLTGLSRDEVQTHIYEIQRRSLVSVDSKLTDTYRQSYSLSEMARTHLQQFGSPDPEFGEKVRKRLHQIARADQVMKQYDNRLALEPAAVIAETNEELAVAHLLRRALGRSRVDDIDGARDLVQQARDAVPTYFETYRVGAFIESEVRPEEARRLYEQAHRLAPDDLKPRVAYWLAEHLVKTTQALEEAAAYAEEAHTALELPGTALRLARIRMYQHRYDEAEKLMTDAADQGVGRVRLIAETDLLDLAKRRAEGLADDEKRPDAALALVPGALERGEKFMAEGFADSRFSSALIDLIAESLRIALHIRDFSSARDDLAKILEGLDRHFTVASSPRRLSLWDTRLEWLVAREEIGEELRLYGSKITARLERQKETAAAGLESGEISTYSGKRRFGFIRGRDGESIFFHRDDMADSNELLYLLRGVEVIFRRRAGIEGGESRPRAESVQVVLPPAQREKAMSELTGVVLTRHDTYLFVEEAITQERIYLNRSAFEDSHEWRAAVIGARIEFDAEFGRLGPQGVKRSARVLRAQDPARH